MKNQIIVFGVVSGLFLFNGFANAQILPDEDLSRLKNIKNDFSFTSIYDFSFDSIEMRKQKSGNTSKKCSEAMCKNLLIQSEFAGLPPSPQYFINVFDGKDTHALSDVQLDPKTPRLVYGKSQTRTSVNRGYNIGTALTDLFFKYNGKWFCDLIDDNQLKFKKFDEINGKQILVFEIKNREVFPKAVINSVTTFYLSKNDNYCCIQRSNYRGESFDSFSVVDFQKVGAWDLPASVKWTTHQRKGNNNEWVADNIFSNIEFYNIQKVDERLFSIKFNSGSQMFDGESRSVLVKDKYGKWLEDISFSDSRQQRSGIIGWLFIGSLSTLLFVSIGWFVHRIVSKRKQ